MILWGGLDITTDKTVMCTTTSLLLFLRQLNSCLLFTFSRAYTSTLGYTPQARGSTVFQRTICFQIRL
jgi:hypothetical protein